MKLCTARSARLLALGALAASSWLACSSSGSSHGSGGSDAGTSSSGGSGSSTGSSGSGSSSGAMPDAGGVWQPTTTAPIHFHWMIGGFTTADILPGQQGQVVYDIDGASSTAADVMAIHAAGAIAVCY